MWRGLRVLGPAGAAAMLAAAPVVAGEPGAASCPHMGRAVELRRAFAVADGGFVGVHVADLSTDELQKLKLEDQGGARVTKVTPGSPAEKAGLKEGDVIVRFHGEPVLSARKLTRLVRETPAGRVAKVDVRRDGAPLTVSVTVAEAPGMGERFSGDMEELTGRLRELKEPTRERMNGLWREWSPEIDRLFEPRPGRLGIRYHEISGQLADYFKLEGDKGLLVAEVEAESPAAAAGIKAGDVILAVGNQSITNARDLQIRLDELESNTVAIKVQRDGRPLELQVKLRPKEGSSPRSRA